MNLSASNGEEMEVSLDCDDLPMNLARESFLRTLYKDDYEEAYPSAVLRPKSQLRKALREFIEDESALSPTYDQLGNTLVLVGETGCGKSTQVPQIMHDYLQQKFPKVNSFRIGVTEPRRLAAISLADRVKVEVEARGGDPNIVAHSVRFDSTETENTQILYMTEGILLRQLMRDDLCLKYNVIIVDEAHERSIATDLVLSYLRKLVYYRGAYAKKHDMPLAKLVLIIMTATAELNTFEKYFPGAAFAAVEGRTHPVAINYLSGVNTEDYLSLTMATVFRLHNELPPSDHFLVFLTGQEEIDGVVRHLREATHEVPALVCPLYAALPRKAQTACFETPPDGTRKIVIATNIAETSLTIPGIAVVIDSGMVKSKFFLAGPGLEAYQVHRISQCQATQRAGRAGRERAGIVYRMYLQEEYGDFKYAEEPEIKRSNLAHTMLMLPNLTKLDGTFEFIVDIRKEVMEEANLELEGLELIEVDLEHPLKKPELTFFGKHFSTFPLEPRLCVVLFTAAHKGILEQACSVVSLLEVENLFVPRDDSQHSFPSPFRVPEGDLVAYLKVYTEYSKLKEAERKNWCDRKGVSFRGMKYAVQVRKQLLELLRQTMAVMRLDYRPNHGQNVNMALLHSFCKTIYWQRAKLDKTGRFYQIQRIPKLTDLDRIGRNRKWEDVYKTYPQLKIKQPPNAVVHAKIHPSSVLAEYRPPHIMFMKATLNERNDLFMHHCSVYDESIENYGAGNPSCLQRDNSFSN